MPKPPKLNNQMIQDICEAVSKGLTNRAACDLVNINENSLYAYIKRGEVDQLNGKNNVYTRLLRAYKKAKADFRVFHMENIRKAATNGAWQASAWTLERCLPDEYGANRGQEQDDGILPDLLTAIKGLKDSGSQ